MGKIFLKPMANNRGFTLIETLVAMAIFSIGIVALYSMRVGSVTSNSKSARITGATSWGEDQVEQFVGMDYATVVAFDNDGDGGGTSKDKSKDGVDDTGKGFGLDDVDAAADGTSTSSDGVYTIFWNVAVDVPMPNTATIRVLIRDNRNELSPPVSLTYIKDDII